MNCNVCDKEITDTGEALLTVNPKAEIMDMIPDPIILCHPCALDGIIYPEMKKSIKKLLIYTFSDVHYNYDNLTEQEKELYTESEFDALVSLVLVKLKDRS